MRVWIENQFLQLNSNDPYQNQSANSSNGNVMMMMKNENSQESILMHNSNNEEVGLNRISEGNTKQ